MSKKTVNTEDLIELLDTLIENNQEAIARCDSSEYQTEHARYLQTKIEAWELIKNYVKEVSY